MAGCLACRPPFHWYGGKSHLARRILSLAPPHRFYCEPFFGAGAVFFAKKPAELETINDINADLMNFFRVLRDHGDEFMKLALYTEYSEALWRECRENWQRETDPIRRAWMWWVVAAQSFSGAFGRSWSVRRTFAMTSRLTWLRRIEALRAVIRRLQSVQIMSRDWMSCMRVVDHPDCWHYLDPPYLPETRREGSEQVYQYEMDFQEHKRLVEFLLSGEVAGMVTLSGYRNELYTQLEAEGWLRIEVATACSAACRTRASGLLGDGTVLQRQSRIECLWLNPAAQRRLRDAAKLVSQS